MLWMLQGVKEGVTCERAIYIMKCDSNEGEE